MATPFERLVERRVQVLRETRRVRRRVQFRREHAKFDDAQPRRDRGGFALARHPHAAIDRGQRTRQTLGHGPQEIPCGRRIERLHELLQTLQLEHQHRAGLRLGLQNEEIHFPHEAVLIGQLRYRIDKGDLLDALHRGVKPADHAVEGVGEGFELIAGFEPDRFALALLADARGEPRQRIKRRNRLAHKVRGERNRCAGEANQDQQKRRQRRQRVKAVGVAVPHHDGHAQALAIVDNRRAERQAVIDGAQMGGCAAGGDAPGQKLGCADIAGAAAMLCDHTPLLVMYDDPAHFATRGGDGGHLIQFGDIVLGDQIAGDSGQMLGQFAGDDELMACAFAIGAEHDGRRGDERGRHHQPGREQHRARSQAARSKPLHDASECAHDVSSTPTRAGARG